MATYAELIYNIKNLMYNGGAADDMQLSDDQIIHFYNIERASLVKQDLDKARFLNPILIQDLGCIEVECADRLECCEFFCDSGEYIYRTVKKIPKPLFASYASLSNNALFTYIGLATHNYPFEFTSEAISNWSKYKKYTKTSIRTFYRNDRIYITNVKNPDDLKIINIKGVFEDPLAVELFKKCDDECFTLDKEYPITSYLLSPIVELVISKYTKLVLETEEDKRNDANDKTN